MIFFDARELLSINLTAEYIQLEEDTASFAVLKDGETLYINFEQSNGINDWITNFDFPAKPYGGMDNVWFVHRGFAREWKVIKPFLRMSINDKTVKNIVIVGYSHGAALAVLCHEYCVFHRPDIENNILGVGYGCPRVVFGFLPKEVKSRFKNFHVVRNCKDLITHLPPVIFGFRHVGEMVHTGKKAKYGLIQSHYSENYLWELMEEPHIFVIGDKDNNEENI